MKLEEKEHFKIHPAKEMEKNSKNYGMKNTK
jgi:hypothetical protein